MKSYDPNSTPEVDPQLLAEGKRLGLHAVHVICDEPNALIDEAGSVSFWALVEFIPRIGDQIWLEDEKVCRVETVVYKATTKPNKIIKLTPTVIAIRIK